MADLSDMMKIEVGSWLALPASFAIKIRDRSVGVGATGKLLAEFHISPGAWIIQAKATIKAPYEKLGVQLLIAVRGEGVSFEDRTLATVEDLGYATLVVVLGVQISTVALVELEMTANTPSSGDASNILITGIKVDRLITGKI